MKSAPESSGIFSHAAQSSTGPREAVKDLFWLPLDSVELRIVN